MAPVSQELEPPTNPGRFKALILQRAYLSPLKRFADDSLKRLGVDITMTPDDWREAGWLVVDRLVNGERFAAETHPREVAEALVTDGVLAAK